MASEMQERVARDLVRSRGAALIADDEHWPGQVKNYYEMCAEWPHYAEGRSLITDAFRDALVAMKAMREPTRGMIDAAYAAHDAYEASDPPAAWCGLSSAFKAMIDAEIKAAEEAGAKWDRIVTPRGP